MKLNRIFIILLCAALAILFYRFDLNHYLTVSALKANRQLLADYYSANRIAAVLGFVAIYALQTTLALPGAAVLSLAAGAIFGPTAGTVYAVSAASAGAIVSFLTARYLLRDILYRRFGRRLENINAEIEQRGLNYLLFLRLVPVFPFFLVNLAAALTTLPLRTFVLGTCLGMLPGAFVFVNAGASLATITRMSDIVSARVFGSLTLLGLFALLPALYARIASKKIPVSHEEPDLPERCRQEAEALFRSGKHHCAEAVLEVTRKHFSPETPETIVHAVSGFGGGSGSGCICGALSGGTVALGMVLGQQRRRTALLTGELHSWFKAQYGAACCSTVKNSCEGGCARLTGEVAGKIAEMLTRR